MSEKMHLCGRRVDNTKIARMTLVCIVTLGTKIPCGK